MKLFIAVSALLATGALGQTPAGSPEADTDLGQTECEYEDAAGETQKHICQYFQECHKSKNATKSMCISKGNKVCDLYSEYATTGDVIANKECQPYETCCDNDCCSVNEQCVEVWGNLAEPISYAFSSKQPLDNIARNDWKTMKGTKVANKPKKCVPLTDAPIMDVTTGMKAVYMPLLGLGVTALIFVVAIVKRQDSILEMLFPLLTIVFSFFLILSEGWMMSLMTTFLAACTMAAGEQDKKWLVWFQLFFMWVYFGGKSDFMFSQAPTNFFTKATGSATIDQLAGACATHFDYYKLHPYQMTFDMDPQNKYTGICGREFVGYQIFIAYGQAFSLFLMVSTTVIGFLNPGESSTTTKNPASNVEMGA